MKLNQKDKKLIAQDNISDLIIYEDKTIKYENGKVTKGSTISSSAAIKTLSGKAAIGFQGELFHEEHHEPYASAEFDGPKNHGQKNIHE